jgi:hypothetical protein
MDVTVFFLVKNCHKPPLISRKLLAHFLLLFEASNCLPPKNESLFAVLRIGPDGAMDVSFENKEYGTQGLPKTGTLMPIWPTLTQRWKA